MSEINLGQVVGPKGDRGDTGLINGATQVQVHNTTKVMYNGSSIPANTAASRMVGTKSGNLMEVGAFGLGASSLTRLSYANREELTEADIPSGVYRIKTLTDAPYGVSYIDWIISVQKSAKYYLVLTITSINATTTQSYMCTRSDGGWRKWTKFYTDDNTTLDGNGALKPSSPVLRVFSDHIEGNADGDAMAATYTKNGVGDYTISGTTGLRTDGWYVVIPNDMNGNPLVAVGTLDDTDGVITLKTYVRIFDMSTFKFVPDLEQPLDIPDGRWVDLRFNDLLIDDGQMEV